MRSKQLGYADGVEQVSRNLVSYHKVNVSLVSRVDHNRAVETPISLSETLSDCRRDRRNRTGTMVDNDNNKRRRLVEFKDGCRYGKFGKTKAYELIAHERIRAYKMGGKTMIDLDSVDEYHASLPRVEIRAS